MDNGLKKLFLLSSLLLIMAHPAFADRWSEEKVPAPKDPKKLEVYTAPKCDKIARYATGAWMNEQAASMSQLQKDHPGVRDMFQAMQNVGVENATFNSTDPEIRKRMEKPVFTFEIPNIRLFNQRSAGICWNTACASQLELTYRLDFMISRVRPYFGHLILQAERYLNDSAATKLDKKTGEIPFKKPEIQDGGWDEQFPALIQAFGIVPQSAQPQTSSSMDSEFMLHKINRYAARVAKEINRIRLEDAQKKEVVDITAARVEQAKKRGLQHIFRILTKHLGDWVVEFEHTSVGPTIGITDKDDPTNTPRLLLTPTSTKQYTPLEMRDAIGFKQDDFVIIAVNDERAPGLYQETKSSDYPGSLDDQEGIRPAKTLNVSMAELKEVVRLSIRAAVPVRITADFDEDIHHGTGIMHPEIFKNSSDIPAGEVFPDLTREDLERVGLGSANHAVFISGYYQPGYDPEKPESEKSPVTWYKVANSWGENAGRKGFYDMSAEWMDQNVYSVMVPIQVLPQELQDKWRGKAKRIRDNFWKDESSRK